MLDLYSDIVYNSYIRLRKGNLKGSNNKRQNRKGRKENGKDKRKQKRI